MDHGFFTADAGPDPRANVELALRDALDLWDAPFDGGYATGKAAYCLWKAAIPDHGAGHGAWWNAVVWRESRERAAEFLTEVADSLPEPRLLEAADRYRRVAAAMTPLTDREAPSEAKLAALETAEAIESEGIELVREVCGAVPTR